MRIDKINDNQIRCFLSKEDMESRQLHLKELAYGTEKARALFHELLREARARFGFEVENMPVMVEAVPLQDDSLVLIVTKVDNPEELDTRFSSFSPSVKSGPPDVDTASTSALSQLLEAIRKEIDGDGGNTPKDLPRQQTAGKVPLRMLKIRKQERVRAFISTPFPLWERRLQRLRPPRLFREKVPCTAILPIPSIISSSRSRRTSRPTLPASSPPFRNSVTRNTSLRHGSSICASTVKSYPRKMPFRSSRNWAGSCDCFPAEWFSL